MEDICIKMGSELGNTYVACRVGVGANPVWLLEIFLKLNDGIDECRLA